MNHIEINETPIILTLAEARRPQPVVPLHDRSALAAVM
jgi:hypothetical protein